MSPSETELPRRGLPAGQHEAALGMRATLDGRWQSVEHLGPSEEFSKPIKKRIPINNSSEINDQVHQDVSKVYPVLDWKPIAIRWQYLGLLVIISLSLAILQELLYRHSDKHNSLLTFGSASNLSIGQVSFTASYAYSGLLMKTVVLPLALRTDIGFGYIWHDGGGHRLRGKTYYASQTS